jgi:hypothetical protein
MKSWIASLTLALAAVGMMAQAELPDGSIQGLNRDKKVGYMGMGAAAVGPYHHCTFELFALDAKKVDSRSRSHTSRRDDSHEWSHPYEGRPRRPFPPAVGYSAPPRFAQFRKNDSSPSAGRQRLGDWGRVNTLQTGKTRFRKTIATPLISAFARQERRNQEVYFRLTVARPRSTNLAQSALFPQVGT